MKIKSERKEVDELFRTGSEEEIAAFNKAWEEKLVEHQCGGN